MRYLGLIGILLCLCAGHAAAHNLPPCATYEGQDVFAAPEGEAESHGVTALGPVDYPAGTTHRNFRFYLGYIIDETGHVICIDTTEAQLSFVPKSPADSTPQREALLDDLARRTFQPFVIDGHAVKVWIADDIAEQELPARHIPPPPGDPATAIIQLQINGHRSGDGPYVMTIAGDGKVSGSPADYWLGDRPYHIASAQVKAMLDVAEKANFWSLKDVYLPEIESDPKHAPFYSGPHAYFRRITITFGGRTKTFNMYDWGNPGVPLGARDLFWHMAYLGGIDLWHGQISENTIATLAQSGFDFKSKKGGELLVTATGQRHLQDSSLYGLIARGTPLDFIKPGEIDTSLLDAAIDGSRGELVDNLIHQGALLTHNKPDPVKITRAFVHAVTMGDPDMVDKLMPYHPSLILRHTIHMYRRAAKVVDDPVITFVGDSVDHFAPRDDENGITKKLIIVTQRLLDAGADLNSRNWNGQSLLSHAVEAHNVEFARWLINKGAVPSETMLIPVYDDETTVLLLEAGIKFSDDMLKKIVDNAKNYPLPKTEAWLKAHGKWPQE